MNKKFLRNAILGLTLSTGIFFMGNVDAATYQGEFVAAPNVAVTSTNYGKIQGYVHRGIYNFKGVQYAHAERFMPPKEINSWSGTKSAIVYGAVCPQFTDQKNDIFPPHWYSPYWEPRNLPQNDDCLNLNIWTPKLDNKKRPVMVWLHGGGFAAGVASADYVYDGENLSRKGDIVVVSVNHRLNSVGFLDLSAYGEKYKYSGNVGMMDIVAALEWIRDNISNFGGDPQNVTLFGQSGGGAKILTLMAMPSAKGLFHKAIEQSGAEELMGMSLPTQDATRRVAELTLQRLNLSANEVDKLQEIPYEQLAAAANEAYLQAVEELGTEKLYPGLGWTPVIDGEIISQNPVDDGFTAQAKDIPLLIGSVANEWTTIDQWEKMDVAQFDNKNYWTTAQIEQKLREKYGANTEKVKAAFKTAYPDKPIANALYIDVLTRLHTLKTMNLKAAQNGAPVYNYLFSWETPVMGGFAMAYHCAEIPFVFNNIEISAPATGATKEAYALADKISQAWINFARTGNPGVKGLPNWTPYTKENGATMILDNKFALRYHHDAELMNLLAPDYKFQ